MSDKEDLQIRTTVFTKLKAKLTYNRATKFIAKVLSEQRGPTTFTIDILKKSHYFSLLICTGILFQNFYSSFLVTQTRSSTFGRN